MEAPPVPLGATPHQSGTSFSVWAPNATAVSVRLVTSVRSVAMASSPGGYWHVDVPGVGSGERYQYIIEAAGSALSPRVDPYAREIDVVDGDRRTVAYDEAAFGWGPAAFQAPGWTELVIYELHVGTFNELAGQQVGTFDDAIAKLPYLSDLGVNGVELLPPSQFAGTLSWGYNPSDPFAVETEYGGPDALKSFIRSAHALGIAVIIDVVYNHMGTVDNDLWAFDGPTPPPGGIYFYSDWRADTGWGSRPDYGRPEVRQYIVDNALAWLEEYRADGLRFDATAWIRSVDGSLSPDKALPDGWLLLRSINEEIDRRQPWKIRIAEDMRGDADITSPTSSGGAGFNTQWDPDFVHQVRGVLTQVNDANRDMVVIRDALQHRYGSDAFARVVFTESHDADANGGTRVPTEIDPAAPDNVYAKKRSLLGALLVFTAPGIPMIFQGQEILETHWFDAQFPVDWTNAQRHPGILTLYRDLIRLRRDWWNTSRGLRGQGLQVHHVNNGDKVIAYHRWDAGGPRDDTLVLANFANRDFDSYTIGFPRPGKWRVRVNSDWTGYDASFGNHPSPDVDTRAEPYDGLPFGADLGVGAYSFVILSQDD